MSKVEALDYAVERQHAEVMSQIAELEEYFCGQLCAEWEAEIARLAEEVEAERATREALQEEVRAEVRRLMDSAKENLKPQ